ncbi:MAG: site-specific integrase [Clostridia bacterium]|nr:site-specific integrase [Clostridia bacterium]
MLNQLLVERDRGLLPTEGAPKTVGEYLEAWLEQAAKVRVRERTYRSYREIVERYVLPELGRARLQKLSPLDLQRFYNRLLERGLSARTVRYVHSVLHSALKQAVKWRMLALNPSDAVELPHQERREQRALSREEVRLLLEALEGDPYALIFEFAVDTGMRPGEYLALRWRDLDLEKGEAHVQRALVPVGRELVFAEPKTAGARRSVPLLNGLVPKLRAYRRVQAERRLAAGPLWEDNDLVFSDERGRPLRERNLVLRHFKPALRRAGLPESIRLYDLRHTCATLLAEAGVPPRVIAAWLGHATPSMTLDVYSHALPSMMTEATRALEFALYG